MFPVFIVRQEYCRYYQYHYYNEIFKMLMRILICCIGIQPRLYETLGLISSTLNPDLVAAYA